MQHISKIKNLLMFVPMFKYWRPVDFTRLEFFRGRPEHTKIILDKNTEGKSSLYFHVLITESDIVRKNKIFCDA